MPLSYTSFPSQNGQQIYPIPFGFLHPTHLTVTVDDVAVTTWTVNTAHTEITFSEPAFTGEEAIGIRRVTPAGTEERPVDYQAGSILTEEDLDTANLHLLFLAQEAQDAQVQGLPLNTAYSPPAWDAQDKRLVRLSAPLVPSDAARLQDVLNAQIGAGALPSVSGADNNSFLTVQDGAWQTTVPATARTSMGLGTVAQLNVGINPTNVVQLDAQSRLPAVDGSLLLNVGNSIPFAGAATARVKLGTFTFPRDSGETWQNNMTIGQFNVTVDSVQTIHGQLNDVEILKSPEAPTQSIRITTTASPAGFMVWWYMTVTFHSPSATQAFWDPATLSPRPILRAGLFNLTAGPSQGISDAMAFPTDLATLHNGFQCYTVTEDVNGEPIEVGRGTSVIQGMAYITLPASTVYRYALRGVQANLACTTTACKLVADFNPGRMFFLRIV